MKAITITCWRRPSYLAEVVESVQKAAHSEEYVVYLGVEPGGGAAMQHLARALAESTFPRAKGLDFRVIWNEKRLRHIRHPREIVSRAFRDGASHVVYLEEDTIISPDALLLAEWYAELPPHDWLCLNLFNFRSRDSAPSEAVYTALSPYAATFQPARFASPWNSLGVVFRPEPWSKIHPVFAKLDPTDSWNWRVARLFEQDPKLRCLHPLTSRANHIGRMQGVFCPPDYHDRWFPHHPMARELPAHPYWVNRNAQ